MGQCLILYRISSVDFATIEQENSWETMQQLAIDSVAFNGSFMALEFMLQLAGLPKELASTTIYPPQIIALDNKFEKGNFDLSSDEKVDAMLTYFSERITYTTPETCQLLWEKLQLISAAELSHLYDSQMLNAAHIYPSCWHDDEADNQAFNCRHLTEDYTALYQFYAVASEAGNYVLSLGEG